MDFNKYMGENLLAYTVVCVVCRQKYKRLHEMLLSLILCIQVVIKPNSVNDANC